MQTLIHPRRLRALELENKMLRFQLGKMQKELKYQQERHKTWKSLAILFHDALWELKEKSEDQ